MCESPLLPLRLWAFAWRSMQSTPHLMFQRLRVGGSIELRRVWKSFNQQEYICRLTCSMIEEMTKQRSSISIIFKLLINPSILKNWGSLLVQHPTLPCYSVCFQSAAQDSLSMITSCCQWFICDSLCWKFGFKFSFIWFDLTEFLSSFGFEEFVRGWSVIYEDKIIQL